MESCRMEIAISQELASKSYSLEGKFIFTRQIHDSFVEDVYCIPDSPVVDITHCKLF